MSLAIFDLDNTLLAGDSDHLWGEFLVEQQVVCKETYGEANKRFYRQYQEGGLDIDEFLQFSLRPLAEHEPDQLFAWRETFVEQKIRPILLQAARELIERHRQAGDRLMVITATNRFVTEPIVGLYGIELLIATTPEFVDGRYTGRYIDIPSFQEGKVKLLEQWLNEQHENLEGSWFYSDSHNDLPLLRRVDNPVAVDPDAKLRQVALAAGWPVISLR
ncbi:HAD family hydrolase [Candidatus Methylospira mobilis]|uniref:HAD family hydrolase n=1 Tax=Candidatus Methylospira mobilis TaxID=1808979 RepID=A0A5Q0BHG7_9GAMM|nr:HAD family hydrolase [Candidatus Methylospira mobilis]QFY41651.1 HAD family hydrolase [Candidatus Methylospira mobilis]WNV05097.1 HAD family hydrolase [Candidatus Methylospira mobilis]